MATTPKKDSNTIERRDFLKKTGTVAGAIAVGFPGIISGQTVTNPAIGCSPEYPGRVIAALATDPEVMKRSGGTFITAEVAQDYGVTDIDGKVIPSLRAERGSPIWNPIVEAQHGR